VMNVRVMRSNDLEMKLINRLTRWHTALFRERKRGCLAASADSSRPRHRNIRDVGSSYFEQCKFNIYFIQRMYI